MKRLKKALKTLEEIGLDASTPIIYVFNKADKVGLATMATNENKIFISAKNRLNLNLLEHEIKKALFSDWKKCKMFIPYEYGKILSYLNDKATIFNQTHMQDGTMVELEISPVDYISFIDYIWVDDKN